MKKIKHYKIIEKLGSGGMGEVFKARDTVLERDVAIKIMHRHLLEHEAHDARFMHEARIIARLVHPNIVTIHEVGKARSGRYIVMEFIGGKSLTSLLGSGAPLEFELAVKLVSQVLAGLEYAHSNEILHRDIKAENILVTDKEHVKIVDFGIAKFASGQGLTAAGDLLGTMEYMAPEQLLGEAVDATCDLYAVGVLLYQMLTNRLPFISDSPAALLYKRLNEDTVPPSFYNAQITQPLDEVILKALHRNRDKRWQTAADFAAALNESLNATGADTALLPGDLQSVAVPSQGSENNDGVSQADLLPSTFIGREKELNRLINLFGRASVGQGQTVLMMGEAGVGKSTLAERLQEYARLHNAWVLYGACLYQEGMDAYLPFIDALRVFLSDESQMLPEKERAKLKDTLRQRVPLLLEFAERFTTNFGSAVPAAPADDSAGKTDLMEGIHSLISFLSSVRPVVLIIDDLQWADEASLRLFHYLVRYVSGHRIMLLGISRTDRFDLQQNGKPAKVVDVLARIRRESNCEEIAVNRLRRDSCDLLIDKLVTPNLFTDELYESIFLETKGNPLFLTETLKQLRETGTIFLADGNWYNKQEEFKLSVPHRVEDIFIRRLSGLDEEEHEILQVAAVEGYKFDPALVGRLIGIPKIKILKILQKIERDMQVVVSTEQGCQFEHPMLRDSLYNEIPPALSREYHLMIADEYEQMHGPDYGALVADFAQHLRRGGAHARAVPQLFQAGVRAFGLSAYREASMFFEDMLNSVEQSGKDIPESISQSEFYFKLGICYEECSRWQPALDAYTELKQLSQIEGNTDRQTGALLRIGRIHGKTGDWEKALTSYERCLQVAKEHAVPNVLSRVYNNMGIIYFQKGDLDKAIQYFEQTLEAVDCEMGVFDKANALTNIGIIANMRGNHDLAMENYREGLKIYEQIGNRKQDEARILHNIGMTHADRNECDEAISSFERCLELAEAVQDKQLQALTHLNLGKTLVRQKKLPQAKRHTEKALKVFKRVDDTLNVAEAYHVIGLVYSSQGDSVTAERYFKESLRLNEAEEYHDGLAETSVSFAKLVLEQGEKERAVTYYKQALNAYQQLNLNSKAEEIARMINDLGGNGSADNEVVHIVEQEKVNIRNSVTGVQHS